MFNLFVPSDLVYKEDEGRRVPKAKIRCSIYFNNIVGNTKVLPFLAIYIQ